MNEAAQILPSDESEELVKLATFSNVFEAELRAAVLNNNGVPTTVFGANVGTVYAGQGFAKIELFVQPNDLARAREILAAGDRNELEPVIGNEPAVDESGRKLVVVGEFETVAQLEAAVTALASANVSAVLPMLAPRGDRPAGSGRRFILRVAEEDVDAAKAVLDETDEDNAPPPPSTGSHFLRWLGAAIGV